MASRLVSDEEGKNYLVDSAIYWERELGIENKTNRDLVFNRIPNHNLVHIISPILPAACVDDRNTRPDV